jgi:putative membrane-bound dehydrogenase-like protein
MTARRTPAFVLGFTLCLAAAVPSWSAPVAAAPVAPQAPEIDPARDLPRTPPVAPERALASWRVRPGFALQLAAHEPQVTSPIAISFDERGRMFVCEMVDYSEQRDVVPHLGRISCLEDRDGDGVYETRTVFAENLAWPTGLICARGGVYVVATPDVLFLKDEDGDGRAERRDVAFTGFSSGQKRLNVQALANCAIWGLDNRIHLQTGGGHRGTITSPLRPDLPPLELTGRDFWFDPRTHEFGAEAGGGQYGMSFDSYGRRFACSNSDHLQLYIYDDRLVPAGPGPLLPAPRASIAVDGGAAEVFRISPDEPWRIVRTRWRIGGVVAGMVEGGGRVSGYFTGATGTTFYRGDAFGPGFPSSTFTGDAGGQLVHRKLIQPDGVSFSGRRAADEANVEFAASTDPWVRVVNFANAPDGSLYLCDMYREVIEHPWSIPETIKQHLDLTSGRDRGRIYRIAPADAGWSRRTSVAMDPANTAELVRLLAHPNGWHRDTASRLLYEAQDPAAIPLLVALAQESSEPYARVHALAALEGFNAVPAATLARLMADPDAGVRERAIAALLRGPPPTGTALAPDVALALAGRADDEAIRVRFHAALAAPLLDSAASTQLRAALARRDRADAWVGAALLRNADRELLVALRSELASFPSAWVAALIETLATDSSPRTLALLRETLTADRPPVAWIKAFGEGRRRAGAPEEALERDAALAPLFARAEAALWRSDSAEADRLDAVALLSLVRWERAGRSIVLGLERSIPVAVQVRAVEAIGQGARDEAGRLLVEAWPRLQSPAQTAALKVLLARPALSVELLHAIERGVVPATDLSAADIEALCSHRSTDVATLARRALASVRPKSREEVLATFQPAIDLRGDAVRGREVFEQRCIICHRAGENGVEVGPNMLTVKSRGRDGLLTAIVDPHREVAPAYVAYTVNTKEGATFQALITRDDASGLTLRLMGGIDVTLARSAIAGSSSEGRSLMPEGLESGLTVPAMADLLTYLEEVR